MGQSFRRLQILDIARHERLVEVDDLARRFGVTSQTIRRDLGELADEGRLERVHGGAMMPPEGTNARYPDRAAINQEAKERIGQACAAQIPDSSSVMLGIGTTTEAVARALAEHKDLTVVTNNLNIADILTPNESFEVIVAGGTMRAMDRALIGELTSEFLDAFKVEHAVIGTSALDLAGDFLDFDLHEVRVSQRIIATARKTILVTDGSKLGRAAPIKTASLRDIGAVFTDTLPDELLLKCDEWDTAVFQSGAGSPVYEADD
ncbi:MAG: DeoR/GlpR family DNA-binding transcription regulator [Pseudomonadota bacterium]